MTQAPPLARATGLEPRRAAARALLAGVAAMAGLVLPGCGGGNGDPDRGLTAEQRVVTEALRERRDRGEIGDAEYEAVRAAIRPISAVEATHVVQQGQRESIDLGIASGGWDGGEECFEPPDFMLIDEVVPRTPITTFERAAIRGDLRSRDSDARAEVDAFLAGSGAPASLDVVQVDSDVDGWGRHHARYRQTHDGVLLMQGGLFVYEDGSGEPQVIDHTVPGLSLDATPTVDTAVALSLARAEVDPTGALGYLTTASLRVDPDLQLQPVDPRGASDDWTNYEVRSVKPRLVHQVMLAPDYGSLDAEIDAMLTRPAIPSDDPRSEPGDPPAPGHLGEREEPQLAVERSIAYPMATPWLVTIDAHTQEVLSVESLIEQDLLDLYSPPNTGTGYGWFNSPVELNTTYWPPFDAYVLADYSRSKSDSPNMVLHGNNLDTHDVADFDLMLDANDIWGNGSVSFSEPSCLGCTVTQTPAVDIAFGVQRTYDFMLNVLGRWGTDDAGKGQIAIAHWDTGYGDAHHNGSSGLIAFGNGSDGTGPGNYSIGTVAHEIGHAIWKQEEVGTSGNTAKAMNEGHGDVIGGLVDIYQDNTDGRGSWLYRIPWTGGSWRSRTLDPAGYDECEESNDIEVCETGEAYWDFFIEISPFEHVAGIPFTRAIMHLAEGTSSDPTSPYYSKFYPDAPMQGIGFNKAAAIWIHMVSHFLPDSPKLAEARFAAWQAAEDLFGENSTEAKATANAFAAVGMGAKAAGPAPPTIEFAKVHTLNHRTLTARTYAVLDDDTGAAYVEPVGMARKNDAFLGYLDMSEWAVGNNTVTFRAVDSDGLEATTTRVCKLRYLPQLLDDGGFEETSGSQWTGGVDKGADEGAALFGEKYLDVSTTPTRQTVDLGSVTGPELSYWVAARKGIEPGDTLTVRVLDAGLGELAVLAVHDIDDDWFPRPARSNGYVNFRHDLSAWEGQDVVIEFAASTNNRYRIDHAVVSFATIELKAPEVAVFDTDNSVILELEDADFAAFEKMGLQPRFHVDGNEVGPIVGTSGGWTLQVPIDSIGGVGSHYVTTVAVDANEKFIAEGNATFFSVKPVNELLTNGRFESQLAGWQMAGAAGSVEIVDASVDPQLVYQGDYAVQLGDVGAANDASITRSVVVPPNPKSLKLTVRARRSFSDVDESVDALIVDYLNASDELLDSAVLYDTKFERADHAPPSNYRTHVLLSDFPSASALKGQTVKVRLRVAEDEGDPSSWVIDNVSFSYSDWGLQIGG